jgi:hypothetical protein
MRDRTLAEIVGMAERKEITAAKLAELREVLGGGGLGVAPSVLFTGERYVVALNAHTAHLRAEQIAELVKTLGDYEDALDLGEQMRFTSALTLLLDQAPDLVEITGAVAKTLSGRDPEEKR